MKLVASIMCQNEINRLPNLINSLYFVDDIYIVDGDSIDGTIEYLESIPKVKLFHNKWTGNHVEQRNYILDKIPKETWILQIDCDELLTIPLRENIKTVLESEEITNIINNCKENQVPTIWLRSINLVKNTKHYDENSLYELAKIFYKKDDSLKWISNNKIHPVLNKELYGISLAAPYSIIHFAALVSEEELANKRKIYTEIGGEEAAKEYYLLWPEKWIVKDLPEYIQF